MAARYNNYGNDRNSVSGDDDDENSNDVFASYGSDSDAVEDNGMEELYRITSRRA